VVHNQKLFRALVSCLSSASPGEPDVQEIGRPQAAGRKRTYSFSDPSEAAISKSLKLSHSPMLSKRTFGAGASSSGESSSASRGPQFNVQTLAATILHTAFQHLDHWPVPLVKAYAEDCFGPRTWVDEPACQLLVQNLALSHTTTTITADHSSSMDEHDGDDDERAALALAVAEFYSMQETPSSSENGGGGPSHSPRSTSPGQLVLRENLSLVSSRHPLIAPDLSARPRSMSSDSVDDGVPPKPPPVATRISSSTGDNTAEDEDSDSGDDQEIEVKVQVQATDNVTNDNDSSSGEEDEEVVVSTESFEEVGMSMSLLVDKGTKNSMAPPATNNSNNHHNFAPSYPVVQRHLNLIRVRQRYFGLNLEYARLAISTSLSDRLDIKSKQNSGLLQSLPAFTSIPVVRTLITGNLEKWLQSPALSGLARSLFAQTVKMMKHVDPPLPADLEAIDNILSMRLKANQVRNKRSDGFGSKFRTSVLLTSRTFFFSSSMHI
jgi:hypothetical protein